MQKLQEVGYRDIGIVNSTDTTMNVISTGLNNNVIANVPAKLVEMTHSTNFAPSEIRTGYLIFNCYRCNTSQLENGNRIYHHL